MKVEVQGADALAYKLKKLGEDVDSIADKGLLQGAQKVQRSAKSLIRQKGAYDTGRLHGSISVEKIPKGYSVGTNLNYAPFIEYGTGTKGDPTVAHSQRTTWRYKAQDGSWHTAHAMRARPYLRPALNANKTYVVKSVRNALVRRLKERISGV